MIPPNFPGRVTVYLINGTSNLFDLAGYGLGPGEQFQLPIMTTIAAALDPNQYNVIHVSYPMALAPMLESVNEGVTATVNLIAANPGPFILVGYSQGAAVASLVYANELRNPAGSLHSRLADLKAGVTFGNPCREAGHTVDIEGYTDPGGHGALPAMYRLTDTPRWWWDFASGPPMTSIDIVASLTDWGADGDLLRLFGLFYQYFTGQGLLTFIVEGLLTLGGMIVTDPNSLVNSFVEFVRWAAFGAHSAYMYTGPIPGNPKTSVQMAIEYINQIGTRQRALLTTVVGHTITAYDRFRFCVEDSHGNILTRDLIPSDPAVTVQRTLSGPSQINFKVHYLEPTVQMPDGSGPIQFKPYGNIIHAMKTLPDGTEKVWASGIVQPSDIDPQTGVLDLKAEGFSNYAKGIPWLQNWNPIAVDPFEIVEHIWNHIQSYSRGNIGVTVYPTSSGTQMLPGFYFDNENFVQDFFAIFIRAVDLNDCADHINNLAQDIPFDYIEESEWNEDNTAIQKRIHLLYPAYGIDQSGLIFRVSENVLQAKPKTETEIEWFSDIIMKGWFPGKEYSSILANADPDRFRRVMNEVDLHLDSTERAAAWAHRHLTRRQWPYYYENITIDPYHINGPFWAFDVGDTIRCQGPFPWKPGIDQKHKVVASLWDEGKGSMELQMLADGQFNYDPIEYVPPEV